MSANFAGAVRPYLETPNIPKVRSASRDRRRLLKEVQQRAKEAACSAQVQNGGFEALPEHCATVAWRRSLLCCFRGELYCLSTDADAQTDNRWLRAEVAGEAPLGILAAATTIGSKFVVHGGLAPHGRGISCSMFAVDLTTTSQRRWIRINQGTKPAQLPAPVCHHTLTLLPLKKALLVHGGCGSLVPPRASDELWEFGLEKQTWRRLPPSGVKRSCHAAALLADGATLAVAGGFGQGGALEFTVSIFNVVAEVWRTITSASPLAATQALPLMMIDVDDGVVEWTAGASLSLPSRTGPVEDGHGGSWILRSSNASSSADASDADTLVPRYQRGCIWACSGAEGFYVVDGALWAFRRGSWEIVKRLAEKAVPPLLLPNPPATPPLPGPRPAERPKPRRPTRDAASQPAVKEVKSDMADIMSFVEKAGTQTKAQSEEEHGKVREKTSADETVSFVNKFHDTWPKALATLCKAANRYFQRAYTRQYVLQALFTKVLNVSDSLSVIAYNVWSNPPCKSRLVAADVLKKEISTKYGMSI